MGDSKDVCHFCQKSVVGTKTILNTCPRCNVRYCSEICYKNVEHLQCTESFYRECVQQELRDTKAENRREFLDKLRRQMQNDTVDSDDESDDEEITPSTEQSSNNAKEIPNYLKQLESLNLEDIDEDDLDEQLDAIGVGHDPNNLITLLNDEERHFLETFVSKK